MNRVRTFMILGLFFALPSAFGLYVLVTRHQPFLLQRWFMYVLLFLLVCGLALPFFAMMNKYFFTAKRLNPQAVLRESIGCAILADVLIWFRIGRVLSTPIIFICIGGFLIVEILFRARDSVEFRPGIDGD